MTVERDQLMEKVVALTKRRGFIFPSSEIYGGLSGLYDYGPYGVALKRAVRELWWRHVVDLRDDVVGLESTLIMPSQVWEASGHLTNFVDPLRQCLGRCKKRWRADHVEGDKCPECGGPLTEPRLFNLMFKTHVGPVEDSSSEVYLRPETAQGMFVDFRNVISSSRVRVPFGIAQQGRAFRNEITPGNFVFRTREFEQAEMEFFIPPAQNDQWYQHWREERRRWYEDFGIDPERLRMREHGQDELAHYSTGCTDVEYEYPFGWGELEGIACRTDFDLRRHSEASGVELKYFDPETKERYFPYVIEPAAGIDRTALTFLIDAYDEETVEGEKRVVLHLHPEIAPITVGVLPLVKKEGMPEKAHEIEKELRLARFTAFYDEKGAIGRRYRRQDEAGTPFCVTVDGDTMKEGVVTVRHRDSMEQDRVKTSELVAWLASSVRAWKRPARSPA